MPIGFLTENQSITGPFYRQDLSNSYQLETVQQGSGLTW